MSILGLHINRESPVSITEQLIAQIRSMILNGKLKGGEKLPSSRHLSNELNISRNTVLNTYDQLLAEGYLESRQGSGTFVVNLDKTLLPEMLEDPNRYPKAVNSSHRKIIRFHSGNPDSLSFPRAQWAKTLKETCMYSSANAYEYRPVSGERELRRAISRYLFRSKGIECEPEDILIIPGTTRGIDLLAGIFRRKSSAVIIEDPSIDFIQFIFKYHGYDLLPVSVDEFGIKTENLPENCHAKLIYVVPSHQFPIGGVLPINRRLQLLDFARSNNAYIIEDDYDSEFRYRGLPIQSLRHLDPDRVIYIGTFSKIFSPGLRLGYMIAPRHLNAEIVDMMTRLNIHAATHEQLAMARFIEEKQLDRHIYKMKKHYEKKRMHLIQSLHSAFESRIKISGANAGLHVLVTFPNHDFCPEDLKKLYENGVAVDWVEDYAIQKGFHRNQLVLGYGNLQPEEITQGVEIIKGTLLL
ncbi:MAG TPA: PLP-dependent aminotransferase family protein [Clostridia bacterium]